MLLRSRSADEGELAALGAVMNLYDVMGDPGADVTHAVRFALCPLGAGVLASTPLIMGHTFLRDHLQATRERLEEFSARLVNALLNRPDVRLGHRN